MLPRQKQLCREITEAYKPWVKDGGIQWLFRDAYTRVGLRWALWSEKDAKAVKCGRMKAARAARRATRNANTSTAAPDSSDDEEHGCNTRDRHELQQAFQHIGVTPAAYFG